MEWIDSELSSPEEWYLQETDVLVHLAAHTANKPYDVVVNCVSYNKSGFNFNKNSVELRILLWQVVALNMATLMIKL